MNVRERGVIEQENLNADIKKVYLVLSLNQKYTFKMEL